MAIVSDVEIRLRVDIARLQQDFNAARRSVSGAVGDIKKTLAGLAAGFSIMNVVQQVIAAQRQFDKLNTSLVTVTGSNKAAGEAFAVLQDFAAKTPFSVQEVTSAFLKLRNLGLTPSERALTSYGNTASGMGKDLNQLIEAVADAATGEFERLKEFGIKSKKQGDQVAFTFQGTTTKVGNSSKEIEDYLMKIGEVNFAGGMERQADTLDGAISNLGDAWDQTLTAFAQSGFGDVVRGGVMALSGALGDLIAMFKSVTGAADEEGAKVSEIGPLHKGLTTFFETIMVLGVNVAYVFKTIGKDLGAFAAQAAMLFNGGIKGLTDGSTLKAVQDIGRARVAEAAQERAEVDKTSEAILGAAAKAQATREKEAADRAKDSSDRLAKYAIAAKGAKALTDAEIAEAKRRADVYRDTQTDLRKKIAESGLEAGATRQLNDAEKMAIDITEQLRAGKLKLTEAQQKNVKGLLEEYRANLASAESFKALAEMRKDAGALDKEMAEKRKGVIDAAKDEVKANEELVRTFGMTETAIARLEVARLKEQLAQRSSKGLTLDEIENLEQLIALKEQSANAVANRAELEKVQSFWTDVEKTAHDTFMSIEDGGKGMWQRMKETAKNTFFNWLYQMTVKKWIINVAASMSGTAGASGIAGAADMISGGNSGLGNTMSLVNMGKSIYSGFSGGMAGSMGGMITQFGSTFGSTAATAFGTGMSTPGAAAAMAELSSGAAGATAGTATAGSAAAGASAGAYAIPIAGWIAAGMALSKGLYAKGWQAENGSMNGLGKFVSSGSKGFDSILRGIGLSASTANMLSGMSTYVRLFGRKNPEITEQGIRGTASTNGFSGSAYANILEKGGVFRSDKRYTKEASLAAAQQAAFDDTLRGMAEAVRGFGGAVGASASTIEGYSKQINLVLTNDEAKNQELIANMFAGVADDLATRMLPNIAQFQRGSESAAQTLERLAGEFKVVDGVLEMLGTTSTQAFRAVGTASIEARTRLVALAGGVDALAQQSQFFADNFLTSAQQIAPVQRELAAGLSALGYSSLETKDDYARAAIGLAESGALATEEGAKLYTELMKLGPAFKAVADYAEEVKAAARDTGREQADLAMTELTRAVDAQKAVALAAYDAVMDRLNAGISSVNDTIERTGDLSRALKAALGTVESPAQQDGMRKAAQAQITASLAIAKAGGALPAAEDMRDALAALSRDASGQFSSLADYQREVARTNNELMQLGGMSDVQLSTAERQLLVLQEQAALAKTASDVQIARFDAMVTNGQFMVSTLSATNTTLNDIYGVVNSLRLQAAQVGYGQQSQSLGAEMLRQLDAPTPNYSAPSATIGTDPALLAALQSLESRMANVETNTQRAAAASAQFAAQFDQVSAGGNALATEAVG